MKVALRPPGIPELAARRSLRARFAVGPIGRRVAVVDVLCLRAVRVRGRAVVPVQRFSFCGEHAACWVALGVGGAVVDHERRPQWLRALAFVGVAYVVNVALKNVLRRKRPQVEGLPGLVKTPTKLSFPSSHAASSFAAARAYSALVPGTPLYATAGAMAVSRVALGVHFPSDVVVGAALGAAIGSAGR